MKHRGRNVSSTKPNLTIDFRTSQNNERILNVLKKFHSSPKETKDSSTVQSKIFYEEGAIYILLKSNLSERPLKFLIDTGASITLVANDAITKTKHKTNYIIKLFGVVRDVSIRTQGIINGIFSIGNHRLETALHLVERKHAGSADGLLGYDFLSSYESIINIRNMTIEFNIANQNCDTNEKNIRNQENVENYNVVKPKFQSQQGAQNQDTMKNKLKGNGHAPRNFQDKHTNGKTEMKMMNKNEFENYYNAAKFYRIELKNRSNMKVNPDNFLKPRPIYSLKNPGTDLMDRKKMIYEKLNLKDCLEDEKSFIKQICEKFPYQFFVDGDTLGSTHVVKHHIRLKPDAPIINVRQYRIPQTHLKVLKDIITDYGRQGIIEKCMSPYNSPAILVEKKDETGGKTDFRFVVDYRKLNQVTEIQNFPIPLIDDILNGLSGCTYFSTLDIKNAFFQLYLDDESRDKSAFSVNNFQYRWVRMPMGLATSPLSWTMAINTILQQLIGSGVYVYLDDVIIYAKTKFEHDKLLLQVMELFQRHNLQLKISKCTFYAREFEYLGHIISKNGMKANPRKVEAIQRYPRPKTIKHIQSFLGLCSYFRRYVRDFSKISRPLTFLLKKEQPFLWTESQEQSFEKLKKALAEEVVLAFPTFDNPEMLFYVTCDASDFALGGCLSQGELPNDRPIYFFSKTLNDAQRRYSTIQKELLAIVESIKAFRVYLYGRFFVLITDHKPLCYLFNMKDCGSRLFRQKMEL